MAHNNAIAPAVSQVMSIACFRLQVTDLDLFMVEEVETTTTARANQETAALVGNSLKNNFLEIQWNPLKKLIY